MKPYLFIICLMFTFNTQAQTPTPKESGTYGQTPSTATAIPLKTAVTQFESLKNQTIVTTAEVQKVCENKGCWMILKDGETQVRTFFKDYGFFVPKEILGKKVRLEGNLVQKDVPLATLRHYLKDAGAPLKEIQSIKTGRKEIQFIATGVKTL